MFNQKGASIIAVIAVMLILAVMGAALISLVTTGSDVSVNQLQSEQAFNVAEGGLQYVLKRGPFPNYSTNGTWINLGAGQFKVDTTAYLTSDIAAEAGTIPVDSTAAFPTAGRITIGTDFGITYTNTDGTNFLGASGGQAHYQNDSVYPAVELTGGFGNNCAAPASPFSIDIAENPRGFDITRPFFIGNEYFYCTGKEVILPYKFTGCTRCYAGSSAEAHPANNSYASQYILTSTGILSSNAQRVVQIGVGPRN